MSLAFASLFVVTLAASSLEENAEFHDGVAFYTDLEFEQALLRFQRAAIDRDLNDEERARVLIWVALCYAGLSDQRGARLSLADALAADLDVELPHHAPPSVRSLFAEEKQLAVERAKAAAPRDGPPRAASSDEVVEAPPPVAEPSPLLSYAFAGVGAAGALVAVVGAGGLVVAGLTLADGDAKRRDPGSFQDDVAGQLELGLLEAAASSALFVIGAAAGVGGAALFFTSLEHE